jgi:nucleotide-binding universal stress UspA family protein
MFKKILVPLDLTDRHDAALQAATHLARANQGEVVLLHVVELIAGLDREDESAFYQRLERRARDHLAQLGSRLTKERIRWHAEVLFGHRAIECAGFAGKNGADSIVLTSPPFRPERPAAGLGSMTWRISLIAACPVLLVKGAIPG